MKIRDLCERIVDGYAAGQSGMDEPMLTCLMELADRADTIKKVLDAAGRLKGCNWFDEDPCATPDLAEAKSAMLSALDEAN